MKIIPLTQGMLTVVDDEDHARLSKYEWYAAKMGNSYYACRKSHDHKVIYMSREILGITDSTVLTDHKNRNGLDNQKHNLRLATKGQNVHNSAAIGGASKYKGVNKSRNKWRAQIYVCGKNTHIGCFKTEDEAAIAYNIVASKAFGEFAYLNTIMQEI